MILRPRVSLDVERLRVRRCAEERAGHKCGLSPGRSIDLHDARAFDNSVRAVIQPFDLAGILPLKVSAVEDAIDAESAWVGALRAADVRRDSNKQCKVMP